LKFSGHINADDTGARHNGEIGSGSNKDIKNKSELLLVPERPDIPLHNNLSESDIREYVKKRKICGSAGSPSGRTCRDTFASIKKTCRKSGVSFRACLTDRVENKMQIPLLSALIKRKIEEQPI